MCKVSILVPICNVEKYLDKCLQSLMLQDIQDVEIICLNDGSTDNSGIIAHEYAVKDNRFKVVDKPNTGYGKTMNMGLSMAKGEYVGIVESDDFVEPDMFSCLYSTAKKYEADVVKSSFWVHTNGHDTVTYVISDDLYDKVISANSNLEIFNLNPSIWSNLYRREFLEKNNIRFFESPGASFQDVAWRVKVFAMAERVVYVKKPFYHYRRDNLNASVRGDGKLFCVCDEYDEAERFLKNTNHWENKFKYLLPYLRWNHYGWNCFGRWLSIESRWQFFQRMRDDFFRYEEEGLLRHNYWNKDSWIKVNSLLSDSRQFFYERYILLLRQAVLAEGFFNVLNIAPKLVVYGAGRIGKEALSVLCDYGKIPFSFAVTNMAGNEERIDNIPVKTIDDFLLDKDECVILIAVTPAAQPEILEQLLNKGFKHIVAFLPEYRQVFQFFK